MKTEWRKEGDVYRLVGKSGYTRAFIYLEVNPTYGSAAYRSVGILGAVNPILERSMGNKRELMRAVERDLKNAGY